MFLINQESTIPTFYLCVCGRRVTFACIPSCFAERGYFKFDNSDVLSQSKTFECRLGTILGGPKISLELAKNLKFTGVTRIASLQETPSSAT